MTNLDALLILNAIPGLGPVRIRTLVSYFGSPEAILCANHNDLAAITSIPQHTVQNIIHFSKDKFLHHEYNLLRMHGVNVLTTEDAGYPAILKEIHDAPAVLYVKGNIAALSGPSVALVGARRASLYGLGMARKFAMDLARAGVTVISGLARGIDTASHEGALKARGITVGVLGCGLSHMYPLENKALAEGMTKDGAVICEFPMETPPVAFNFPRRNRIISGLSKGVVVIEAALKSGALITSDFALEQGREVFAVPGKADELAAQGTNQLIKEGAKLTTCVEDILQDLALELQEYRRSDEEPQEEIPTDISLTQEESRVYASVKDQPLHIDELADKNGLSVMQLAHILFRLELKRIICQLPGQKYQKLKVR